MEPSPVEFRPERLLEHADWLRRLAGTLVLDAARADDVTQQTLLEALQRAPARVDHPRAWLATTARNFARAFGRSEARRERIERVAATPEAGPAADEVVERTARHHLVVGAVLALAEPYRTALLLRFFENLKPAAIAKRTGVPVETVRTRLKRGLELLRAELVQRRGNWAAVVVGLIEPSVHAAATRMLLAKAGIAGSIAGGVAMSMKAKVAIGVVVVACALVAIVEIQSISDGSVRGDNADIVGARGARSAGANGDATTTTNEPMRSSVGGGTDALDRSTIHVRVTDGDGAPIEGARVGVLVPEPPYTLEEHERRPTQFEFVADSTATTSASGECVVPMHAGTSRPTVDVAAMASRHAPAYWPRARGGDSISFTLDQAGTLRGVVRDLGGEPIAGALVALAVDAPRLLRIESRSGKDGSYELAPFFGPDLKLPRFESAMTWITVHADGFVPLKLPAYEKIHESAVREWTFDPWLGRGATVRGRVRDRATGVPVDGADVWIRTWYQRRDEIELKTRSATDGRFELAHVPAWGVLPAAYSRQPGSERILLGEICACKEGGGRDAISFDVPDEGEDVSFEMSLGEVGGVRGRVVDSLGRAMAGVNVYPAGLPSKMWWERDDVRQTPSQRTFTDGEGRYELRELLISNGTETLVSINAVIESTRGGFAAQTNRLVPLVAGEVVDVDDLIVDPPDAVSVRILDETGTGIPNALVRRWNFDVRGKPSEGQMVRSGPTGGCLFPFVRSSESRQSRTSITVDVVGFAFVERELKDDERAVEIELAPEHHLHGHLRDADGSPGAARIVAVQASKSPEQFASELRSEFNGPSSSIAYDDAAARTGRFVLRGLGPGPWHVAAVRRFDGARPTVVVAANVRDETSEIEIVMPRSAEPYHSPWMESVKAAGFGTVDLDLTLAASGRPAFRGGSATLERDGDMCFAHPVAPGRYSFEHVPAGSWDLRLDLPGKVSESRTVVVEADRTTTIAIAIPVGLEASGRIDLAGLPNFSDGQVHFVSDDGGGSLARRIENDGTYRVPGLVASCRYRCWIELQLPDGQWRQWAAKGDSRPAHEWDGASPTLVAAGELLLRFDNEPDRDRSVVRVLDAKGRERMVLHPGRYEIEHTEGLELGTYTVRVEISGEPTRERACTLDFGHRAVVEIPFADGGR